MVAVVAMPAFPDLVLVAHRAVMAAMPVCSGLPGLSAVMLVPAALQALAAALAVLERVWA
jgi:hypothetical protein